MAQVDSEKKTQDRNSSIMKSLIGTSSFRNLKIDQDSAMFSKCSIAFKPTHPITHLIVRNNHLALAMSNKMLIRIDLLNPKNIEEIDLSKVAAKAKVYGLFMDPLGEHMIISVVGSDNVTPVDVLYLPWKSLKPRLSTKFKGMLVTAVAWNPKNISDSFTGQILCGTSKGLIYELELTSDEKFLQSGHERNMKQVYDLSPSEDMPWVSNLEIIVSPKEELFYLILCTTSTKLIKFSGYVKSYEDRFPFTAIFQNYSDQMFDFIEHPNTSSISYLQMHYVEGEKAPKSFLWLVNHTLFIKEIVWSDTPSLFKNVKHITLPDSSVGDLLRGFVPTTYHVLILWSNKICGLCLMNSQIIFAEDMVEDSTPYVGICKDISNNNIWVFSSRGIQKYKVVKEDRNLWKIHMENGDFELAKKYCHSDQLLLSFVLIKEAEHMFENKEYIKSAELFSQTPSSFEEVCLRFLEAKAEDALKLYLSGKLKGIESNDTTQLTLIVLWLMELHARNIGSLRDTDKKSSEYEAANKEFNEFLQNSKVRKVIKENPQAIYSLLASHDDQENYEAVALIMNDLDRVIQHLISRQQYRKALQVMCTQNSDKLFYKHIPSFIQVVPDDTLHTLISQGNKLNPTILLPSLVHAHSSYGLTRQVLKYIEHCVDILEVKDEAIHNFLITLYCSTSQEKLMDYLKLQGEDSECVNYDVKFALRECATANHDEACIHIMTIMGLYQEAVTMALSTNTSLAKAIANRIKISDPELCRKLWLEIAAHVVQNEENVSTALEILKECNLIKIEDILPFFPDFVTIDEFKDVICSSLEEYNEHIEKLEKEIEEASKTAKNIRAEIKNFKKKHFIVKTQDRCMECEFPLFTCAFYVFPCSHKFHQECLTEAVMSNLSEAKQKHLSELKGKIIALNSAQESSKGIGSTFLNEKEQLRLKIDAIVASECLYCGELAINLVDTPFIPDEEWKSQLEEWL